MEPKKTKISGASSVDKQSAGAPTPSPLLKEASAQHAQSPVTKPNNPLGVNRHTTISGPNGDAGKGNGGSTFTAPRKGSGGGLNETGYTRMPMYTGGNGKGNGKR